MMRRWMIGGALFASLALNAALGAAIAGKAMSHRGPPMKMVFASIDALPEPERGKAMAVLDAKRSALRELMRDAKETRRGAFDYVVSGSYERAEAEKKLAELRVKTAAAQAAAQNMMLEIADQLPAEHREAVFNRARRSFP